LETSAVLPNDLGVEQQLRALIPVCPEADLVVFSCWRAVSALAVLVKNSVEFWVQLNDAVLSFNKSLLVFFFVFRKPVLLDVSVHVPVVVVGPKGIHQWLFVFLYNWGFVFEFGIFLQLSDHLHALLSLLRTPLEEFLSVLLAAFDPVDNLLAREVQLFEVYSLVLAGLQVIQLLLLFFLRRLLVQSHLGCGPLHFLNALLLNLLA